MWDKEIAYLRLKKSSCFMYVRIDMSQVHTNTYVLILVRVEEWKEARGKRQEPRGRGSRFQEEEEGKGKREEKD